MSLQIFFLIVSGEILKGSCEAENQKGTKVSGKKGNQSKGGLFYLPA